MTNIQKAEEIVRLIPKEVASVKIARVFEDNDTVVLHTIYTYPDDTQKIAFDLVTFNKDGEMTERKTYRQPLITDTKSGRSMYDGETDIKDIDRTEENKKAVSDYLESVIGVNTNKADDFFADKANDFFDGDNQIQHSPYLPDTVSGLMKAGIERIKQGKVVDYQKIDTVLGQGNFVLIISEGHYGKGSPQAIFCDLYRLENGKLVEHWDVIETN